LVWQAYEACQTSFFEIEPAKSRAVVVLPHFRAMRENILEQRPMTNHAQIDFTVQIWKEGNQFVAHAMPLDVMSAGDTPDEARKAVDEAVIAFLSTVSSMGTLHDVLAESGYRQEEGKWISPDWIGVERHLAVVSE
jgi:predicted RNase H-like HicB family nuclease